MPVRQRVDKARRRVWAEVSGTFTLGEIVAAIAQALGHPDFEPGFDILSDHTQITEPITSEQLQQMASHLKAQSHLLAGSRWAVVATQPASYGMMRVWSVLAEQVPLEVHVFDALEDAEQWLASPHSRRAEKP